MCGRYTLCNIEGLLECFGLDLEIKPRYNIAPSQMILAIVQGTGYKAVKLKWGLIPSWAKNASGLINARAETVVNKPAFRDSFRKRRCLIPADGFFEWRKEASGRSPYRITLKNEEVFAFAGIWDAWTQPGGETVYSCAIITTCANELVAPIHDRMPVILTGKAGEIWLEATADTAILKKLLKPYPASLMKSYEVSPLVNSPGNDRPDVLLPYNRPAGMGK